MMSIDKRAYGVRDFYKHVLEGTDTENPGWDSFVVDVLSMLRLVIGYKPTHVPKVSGVHGLRGGRLGAAGGFQNPTYRQTGLRNDHHTSNP